MRFCRENSAELFILNYCSLLCSFKKIGQLDVAGDGFAVLRPFPLLEIGDKAHGVDPALDLGQRAGARLHLKDLARQLLVFRRQAQCAQPIFALESFLARRFGDIDSADLIERGIEVRHLGAG